MHNEKIHKRGRYSAEFREKVALDTLMGSKNARTNCIGVCNLHGAGEAKEGISGAFRKGVKTRKKELEEQIVLLRNALCKRGIEVEWLIKKSKELGL